MFHWRQESLADNSALSMLFKPTVQLMFLFFYFCNLYKVLVRSKNKNAGKTETSLCGATEKLPVFLSNRHSEI